MRFLQLLPVTEDAELVHHSRHFRAAIGELWQAYSSEYLTALQKFTKSSKCQPYQYEVGEFVHLLKEGSPKDTAGKTIAGEMRAVTGRYKIGRIRQIHTGPDEISRVFIVDTGGTEDQWKRVSYMNIAPLFL